MDKIQTTYCYVPVDDESPNRFGWVIKQDGEETIPLEKEEGVILLTIKDASKLFGEIWDAAHKKEHEWNQYIHFEDTCDEKYKALPDKKSYIKSLLP